jgi:hypothetical protein
MFLTLLNHVQTVDLALLELLDVLLLILLGVDHIAHSHALAYFLTSLK